MISKLVARCNKNYLRLVKKQSSLYLSTTPKWFSSSNFMSEINDVIDIDSPRKPKGRLLVIPTPIGNLQDISIRQYEYLLQADIIACEDTRVTGKLFKMLKDKRIKERFYSHFDIVMSDIKDIEVHEPELQKEEDDFDRITNKLGSKAQRKLKKLDSLSFLNEEEQSKIDPEGLYGVDDEMIIFLREKIAETREKKGRGLLISYFQHNEEQRIEKLIKLMRYGLSVALVSDAGTPTISDPGYRLVDNCRKEDIFVDAIPGPNAVSLALSLSGFPSDRYIFEGYISKTSSLKVEKLERIKELELTTVVFESNARLMKTLLTIEKVFGEQHNIFIAFELTKMHEYTIRGAVRDLFEKMSSIEEVKNLKGEITIVIAPYLPNFNVTLREQMKEMEKGNEAVARREEASKLYSIKSQELVSLLNKKLESSSDKGLASLVADILNISKNKAMGLVKDHRYADSTTMQKKVIRTFKEVE